MRFGSHAGEVRAKYEFLRIWYESTEDWYEFAPVWYEFSGDRYELWGSWYEFPEAQCEFWRNGAKVRRAAFAPDALRIRPGRIS